MPTGQTALIGAGDVLRRTIVSHIPTAPSRGRRVAPDERTPDHVRRQAMRQARYALNVSALDEDRVPPEGPFDVALTNGLLAVVGEADPTAVIDKKGFTLPASALLPKAAALGISIDQATLAEGLDLTQPLRHSATTPRPSRRRVDSTRVEEAPHRSARTRRDRRSRGSSPRRGTSNGRRHDGHAVLRESTSLR